MSNTISIIGWCSCRLTVTRQVSLVEQELPLSPTEHLSSSPVAQSLSFCVMVCGSLLVLLSVFVPVFFFVIVLSVRLQFTTSNYPFGIFHFFSCIYWSSEKNNYNVAVYVSKTATIAIYTVSKISLKYNFQQFITCSLVAITNRPFPRSSLITEFVARVTQQVPLVEQKCLHFQSSQQVLVEFVLLDLWFSVSCFVDSC